MRDFIRKLTKAAARATMAAGLAGVRYAMQAPPPAEVRVRPRAVSLILYFRKVGVLAKQQWDWPPLE